MWFKVNKKKLQTIFDGIGNVVKGIGHRFLLNIQDEGEPYITPIKSKIKQQLGKLNTPSLNTSSPLKDTIRQYINQNVEFNTSAGIVEGILTEVGDDYVEIYESKDMIVIVQLENTISFKPC